MLVFAKVIYAKLLLTRTQETFIHPHTRNFYSPAHPQLLFTRTPATFIHRHPHTRNFYSPAHLQLLFTRTPATFINPHTRNFYSPAHPQLLFTRTPATFIHPHTRNFYSPAPAGNGNDQNSEGGGYFRKFFGQGGGISPEVSNFDPKSRFLALLSHN